MEKRHILTGWGAIFVTLMLLCFAAMGLVIAFGYGKMPAQPLVGGGTLAVTIFFLLLVCRMPWRVSATGNVLHFARLRGPGQVDLADCRRVACVVTRSRSTNYHYSFHPASGGKPIKMNTTGNGNELLDALGEMFATAHPGQHILSGTTRRLSTTSYVWQLPPDKSWAMALARPYSPGFDMGHYIYLFILGALAVLALFAFGYWMYLNVEEEGGAIFMSMAVIVAAICLYFGLPTLRNRLIITDSEIKTRQGAYPLASITHASSAEQDLILHLATGQSITLPRPAAELPATIIAAEINALLKPHRS